MQTQSKRFLPVLLFRSDSREQRPFVDDRKFAIVDVPHSVALKFGPYFQANLDGKWIGCVFVSCALYGIAALLANEWMYLLSCALFTAAFFGLVLPFVALAGASLDCWLPATGVDQEDADISLIIRPHQALGRLGRMLPLAALRCQIILTRRQADGSEINEALAKQIILIESASESAILSVRVPHLNRGIYQISHINLCSAFPFGLVWWQRKFRPDASREHNGTIVVYPRVYDLRGNFLLQIQSVISTMGLAFSETLSFMPSTSVRGVRDFRVGDSLRHVHWRSTARQGKLLVREFDSETLPVFDLFLDLTSNWRTPEQFELAVAIAHSLIQFGNERDMLPQLVLRPPLNSPELEPLMQDLPRAAAALEMLSEILARVEPISVNTLPAHDIEQKRLLALVPSGDTMLRGIGERAGCPINLVAIHDSPQSYMHLPSYKWPGALIATIYGEEDLEAL